MEKTGIELIAKERKEQIEKHGRTVEKDAKYNKNQLLGIAEILMKQKITDYQYFLLLNLVNQDVNYADKLRKKDYKDRLVIAAALIAARIDSIDFIRKENNLYLSICV